MFIKLSLCIVFVTCLRITSGDGWPQIMANSMNPHMSDKAISLVRYGFDNQWDATRITDNITKEFDSRFGAEWFAIVGPSGFVANFNSMQNSLIWLQWSEFEIVLYKPKEAEDFAVIKSARIGEITEQYIHSTVNSTLAKTIEDLARQAINSQTTYRTIQATLRVQLDSVVGGKWMAIVTSSSPNYDSDWDAGFCINYAMEFDVGSLRIFVYQKCL